MTDIDMTRALERCELPDDGFHHADHLRVALVYLDESAQVRLKPDTTVAQKPDTSR